MTVSLREQVPRPDRSRVTGNAGAVTAMTANAARAGAEALAAGGNAADAAVAAMLAAGVVEPAMNGLGGTAYAVIFDPAKNRITALDGSARCPARAHETMFEPLEGVGGGLYGFPPTRGDHAETGPLSVLAPTAPATLVELHRRFGRLPFPAVVEPAVQLAEEGFVPDWVFAVHAAAGYRRLRLSPAAFGLYTRKDGIPFVPAGDEDRLRNPDLAASLRVLAEEGPEPFQRGPPRPPPPRRRERGGRHPLRIRPRRPRRPRSPSARLGLPGPHGQRPCPATPAAPPSRRRSPTSTPSPRRDLPAATRPARSASSTSPPSRCASRSSTASRTSATPRACPSRSRACSTPTTSATGGRESRRTAPASTPRQSPCRPGSGQADGAPPSGAPTSDCTTHVNAMDADGMAVALTGTLGGRFGSAFAVPGLGYPLNNGMMWFDPRPGRRISPAPGRRALHAAAPTILLRHGTPWAVVGSPGGRRLISAAALGVARLVDRGASMQDAVGGSGFHADVGPLTLDERTPDCGQVARGLEARGHRVLVRRETALTGHFGRASGIRRVPTPAGEAFEPGVDPVRTGAGVAVDGQS